MAIALSIWILTIVAGLAIGTFLCWRIEQSGVARWGATGKLFRAESKEEAQP